MAVRVDGSRGLRERAIKPENALRSSGTHASGYNLSGNKEAILGSRVVAYGVNGNATFGGNIAISRFGGELSGWKCFIYGPRA